MPPRDVAIGVVFAVAGAFVAGAGWRMPEGVGGIPGPGFFPLLIGAVLGVLGCALAVSSGRSRAVTAAPARHLWPLWQVTAIAGLLAAYVAAWDAVPFLVRTPILLLAIARVVGESWWRGAASAVLTTLALAGIFDLLLRVRL